MLKSNQYYYFIIIYLCSIIGNVIIKYGVLNKV